MVGRKRFTLFVFNNVIFLIRELKENAFSKGLGGTSFLNFLMYVRGSPKDFDNWANITGDSSWNYENLLPHFKAIENFHGEYENGEIF